MLNTHGGGYVLGDYRERAVPRRLAGYVEVVWTHGPRGEGGSADPLPTHRVIPDTGLSLCFTSIRGPDGLARDPRLAVMGPIRRIRFDTREPGRHMEAVRLKPEWARALLGVDPGELTDVVAGGRQEVARRLPGLEDRLARTRGPAEAVRALVRAVGSLAECHRADRAAELAHRALESIRADPSATRPAADQAARLGVSPRHLRRATREVTGAGLKYFQRVWRLQRTLSLAESGLGPGGWCALALAGGYHDQAHAIREFRELTGVTPPALVRERARQR